MSHLQTEEDFKRIMNFTSSLVKNGDFKQVIKIIKSQLDVKNPSTILALSMLAGIMKDKGKLEDAYDLYKSIYGTMNESLGRDHRDTLLALHNVSLCSSSESETNRILVDLVATSSTKQYDDLLVKFSKSLDEFRSKLSMTKRRLYEKLEVKTSDKNNVTQKPKQKHHITNEELDLLVKQFGLEEKTKSKKKNH